MKKHLGLLLVIFSIISINFLCGDTLFDMVREKYRQVYSLHGNFYQTICSENYGTCQEFSGKFYILRPYYTRLEVASPQRQLIISDSLNLYIYLIDQKRIYEQSSELSYNFFKLFDAFMNESQRVIKRNEEDGLVYYTCVNPKDSLNLSSTVSFENFVFGINKKSKLIEAFSFVTPSSDEVTFKLSALKVNEKIPRKMFLFKIPQGVEVIKLK
ncbi:MAG: outer-membrane lipoprotein carrier protein LolA [candidate division WOR-3 bacterium]